MKLRRLFVLVPDCHVPGWRYGAVWRRLFADGLVRSGVEVVTPHDVSFAWARPAQDVAGVDPTERERTSARLLDQIHAARRGGIDAVLSYCFAHDLELDVVDDVRGSGVPWVNFFCDSLSAFPEALARRTSLNWFVESAAQASYEALGVPALCQPYAFDPSSLPDASCTDPHRKLAFVGAAYGGRVRQVARLRLMGVKIDARGKGWDLAADAGVPETIGHRVRRTAARAVLHRRCGGPLPEEELVSFLRGTQVVLGLTEGPDGTPPYLKLRDVELPGMGCCCLTQEHEDVARLFDTEREVRTFRSLREARRIAKDLGRHPEECRRMGERARARVLAEHTWATRLRQLAGALG